MDIAKIQLLLDKGKCLDALKLSSQAVRSFTKISKSEQKTLRSWQYLHIFVLSHLKVEDIDSDIEKEFIYLSKFQNVTFDGIYVLLSNYISEKYTLNKLVKFNPDHFIKDELVVFCLENIRVMNPYLEKTLTAIRGKLLALYSSNHSLNHEQLRFSLALINQLYQNEYIYFQSDAEKKLCTLVQELIAAQLNTAAWIPVQAALPITVLLMYKPLAEVIKVDSRLSVFEASDWPEFLQEYYKSDVVERSRERELAKNIPKIGVISDSVTSSVREQYEENPYPRWLFHRAINEYEYNSYVKHNIGREPSVNFENLDAIRVLVAGCGTGRQPIEIASQLPKAQVLAVDISLASLGYAKRKADELGLSNISFLHADILELHELSQKFELIACCGVLHHMSEPIKGWKVLRGLLSDHGLMHIALYSEAARQELNNHRAYIKTLGLTGTRDDIRSYRASAANSESCGALVGFYDYWNTSECRDLVFHVQEHQFTWREISLALDELGLDLASVSVSKRDLDIFKALYPSPNSELNLDNWHAFEALRPKTFAGMMNFWCSTPGTLS